MRGVSVPPYAERRRQIESERCRATSERFSTMPLRLRPIASRGISSSRASGSRTRRCASGFNGSQRGLAGAGVRKGSHVGVMLPNIAAMPTTWLALARLAQ
jgi:crotonobetaine/carnitine-CoA ligase